MLGVVKEYYRTGHGKEYEWVLVRPWYRTAQDPMWYCWIVASPLSQNLPQNQNVQICIRLPFLLLAQLNQDAEEIPEEFTRLGVQLILEKQSVPPGEVKLLYTDEGLMLELLGKTETNELLVSWAQETNFSMPMIVARLGKALSDAREQQQRIGFH